VTCGIVTNGCGGTLNCGSCPANESCGGGGVPNQCGSPACTAKTCAQLGYNCGSATDGCGGVIMCGTCTAPQTCGGGIPSQPNVCGTGGG
jgi:hypothetical protein